MRTGPFLVLFFWGSLLSAQIFKDCTAELGINHPTLAPYMMAGGISVFDFNQDGYEDLYFTGGEYPDQLFLNIEGKRFENVTTSTGLDQIQDRYTMGVVAGDLDNDGYPDLFVSTHRGERNICLRNVNGEYFEDVSVAAGFFGTKWSSSASMADTDLDGDLDIYVGNYVDFFEDPFFLNVSEMQPNHFFENKGDWEFEGSADLFMGGEDGCTLVSCFSDFDNDMDPDLFIINDLGWQFTPNELYVNQNNEAGFLERAAALGVAEGMNGMGIAIGDVNADGYFDYYFSNIGDNPFYLGSPAAVFQDVTSIYQVNDGLGYSWGTFFADMNNDTYDDLFVAKGSISEGSDPQENKLYLFDPNLNDFTDVSEAYGLNDPNKARGAVFADLNADGWLDVVINNIRVFEDNLGQAQVYLNRGYSDESNSTNRQFLKLKLEGSASNRSAYGAFVELFVQDKKMIRELRGGSSYLSNNSSIVHFGLGNLAIDSMVVTWPSLSRQVFTDLNPNTFYYLLEGNYLREHQYGLPTSSKDIQSPPELSISIFPNPAKRKFSFQFNDQQLRTGQWTIYDPLGGTIDTGHFSQTALIDLELNAARLSSGLYFLKVESSGASHVEKLFLGE